MDELVQRAGRKPDKPFADLGGFIEINIKITSIRR